MIAVETRLPCEDHELKASGGIKAGPLCSSGHEMLLKRAQTTVRPVLQPMCSCAGRQEMPELGMVAHRLAAFEGPDRRTMTLAVSRRADLRLGGSAISSPLSQVNEAVQVGGQRRIAAASETSQQSSGEVIARAGHVADVGFHEGERIVVLEHDRVADSTAADDRRALLARQAGPFGDAIDADHTLHGEDSARAALDKEGPKHRGREEPDRHLSDAFVKDPFRQPDGEVLRRDRVGVEPIARRVQAVLRKVHMLVQLRQLVDVGRRMRDDCRNCCELGRQISVCLLQGAEELQGLLVRSWLEEGCSD